MYIPYAPMVPIRYTLPALRVLLNWSFICGQLYSYTYILLCWALSQVKGFLTPSTCPIILNDHLPFHLTHMLLFTHRISPLSNQSLSYLFLHFNHSLNPYPYSLIRIHPFIQPIVLPKSFDSIHWRFTCNSYNIHLSISLSANYYSFNTSQVQTI